MADTVLVTAPDDVAAILSPTLSDAIAAAQLSAATALAAQISASASQVTALNAAIEAQNAASAAISAATTAASSAAAIFAANANAGSPTITSRARLQRALNAVGNLQLVNDYIMNNYGLNDDTSVEWTEAAFIPVNGLVYVAIKLAVPYTDAQAVALWAAAFALPN